LVFVEPFFFSLTSPAFKLLLLFLLLLKKLLNDIDISLRRRKIEREVEETEIEKNDV
jgi:hypothetical protein